MILRRNSSSRAEKRCAFRQIAPSAEYALLFRPTLLLDRLAADRSKPWRLAQSGPGSIPRYTRLRRSGNRPALCVARQNGDVVRAPAGLAPSGKACPRRRRADLGGAVRLRPVL